MEYQSEVDRLYDKLARLWQWLDNHSYRHPKYLSREDNFIRTLRAYERACDNTGTGR